MELPCDCHGIAITAMGLSHGFMAPPGDSWVPPWLHGNAMGLPRNGHGMQWDYFHGLTGCHESDIASW